MSVGLVLEGGGMRGLYTAGVLDALLDAGISVDGIVAVSAGALFGVNYVSGQKGRVLRYNKRFISDRHYMGLYSLLTTGNIVNKDFTYYEIPMKLDVFDEEAFEKANIPFYVVATNVETGKAEYLPIHNVFDDMEAFRATSALPIVSKMVEWQGKKYLDGGMADSLPVDFAKSLGFDKIIVVQTRPLDYRKKPSSAKPYQLFYRRYPEFIETASHRYQNYNASVEKIIAAEEAGEVFCLRPRQPITIGRLEKNVERLEEVYQAGIDDTERRLFNLRRYLHK